MRVGEGDSPRENVGSGQWIGGLSDGKGQLGVRLEGLLELFT